jgi:hypothetical protein
MREHPLQGRNGLFEAAQGALRFSFQPKSEDVVRLQFQSQPGAALRKVEPPHGVIGAGGETVNLLRERIQLNGQRGVMHRQFHAIVHSQGHGVVAVRERRARVDGDGFQKARLRNPASCGRSRTRKSRARS